MNIKGMNKNMQCRDGFQFEVGKEYKIETNGRPLKLCSDTVFHYCKSLQQVHNFYNCYNDENRYFEIEVLGEEVTDGIKCGSNHIRIVREITGEELNNLKGRNNGNTGLFNNGDRNSGYFNDGDKNTGDWNSGECNSGNRNTGHNNIGNWNSGCFNNGDWNSGIANKCNFSSGIFCNKSDMNIRIFNKPSGMSSEEFRKSRYWDAMCESDFNLIKWINYTVEEKRSDPEKERVGGYLKIYSMEEAWANWWNKLSEEAKQTIQEIPNFDPEIFKDITGIEV